MGKKQIDQSVYIHENDLNRKSYVEEDFQFQKRIQHSQLGRIDLLIHPQTREALFKKSEIFNEKLEALYSIDYLKRLKAIKKDYVLTLRDFQLKTESGLCSTSYALSAYYPFKHKTLFQYMQELIKIQKDFTEIELIQIMYSILLAIQDLKTEGITVHDICPKRIYFDPQNLETKFILCDQLTNYGLDECKSFQLKKIVEQQDLFLSPVLYQNLKENNINFYLDQDKENSFALGLTLLQAGTQTSIQDIYGGQQELDIQKLQYYIDNFRHKYEPQSTLLYQCVLNLLFTSQSQRLTPTGLLSKIPPYNQMRPFLLPDYLQNPHERKLGSSQNLFNNVVEKNSGFFFNPLKESYMIPNNTLHQQNAKTGINRGVFDKLETQDQNQQVVGFQVSHQHQPQPQPQQTYNYQNNFQQQQNNFHVQQNTNQYQNFSNNQNQTYSYKYPQQKDMTIDFFDVSYEKPKQKQNVFYAPLKGDSPQKTFNRQVSKNVNTYSHLFQTREFLEVTKTPEEIQNKEKQLNELRKYQQKQQKYSFQRFDDSSQRQLQRNHSQNKVEYTRKQNTNTQANPLVYNYNQQPNNFNYQNTQYQKVQINFDQQFKKLKSIEFQIFDKIQIKKQCKKKLSILQKKKIYLNQYQQKSIGINKRKTKIIPKNQYIVMLQFKKRLIEYYDAVKDPIKYYFMDKMQNVLFFLHSNQDQKQIQDINLPKKSSNFLSIIKDFSLLKEKFSNCENFSDMRQNQRRKQKELLQTIQQESNKENKITNQIDQSQKIHQKKQSVILDQLKSQQENLNEKLYQRRQRSMSKSRMSHISQKSQTQSILNMLQNLKLDKTSDELIHQTKRGYDEYYKKNNQLIQLFIFGIQKIFFQYSYLYYYQLKTFSISLSDYKDILEPSFGLIYSKNIYD